MEARFYEKLDKKTVKCILCPHSCIINTEKKGICGVRKNKDGILIAESYGQISSLALDPIEKKPLSAYKSGSLILSVGSYGCNFRCKFCQNWTIAQRIPKSVFITPFEIAQKALELKSVGNIGVAYTYNEPIIGYEFIFDTAKLVKEHGMDNVLVTNGFILPKPLKAILPYIDAMNIDVKAFNFSFYKNICFGSMKDVKRTVEIAASKCHVEVTYLIIPGFNDDMVQIENMAKWLSKVSPDIILHFSRFFPKYKMSDIIPTPIRTLNTAKEIAEKYLKRVVLGNVK